MPTTAQRDQILDVAKFCGWEIDPEGDNTIILTFGACYTMVVDFTTIDGTEILTCASFIERARRVVPRKGITWKTIDRKGTADADVITDWLAAVNS